MADTTDEKDGSAKRDAGGEDEPRGVEFTSLKALYESVRDENSVSYTAWLKKVHRLEQGNKRTVNAVRRKLGLPVVRRERVAPPPLAAPAPLLVECIECGAVVAMTSRAKLYCSEACQQTLSLVRYIRRTIADGRWDRDPAIEDVLQMQLAHILAGGYHKAARRVPPKLRAEIFERDGNKCVLCGAPATEIDHIAGDANTPDNLRAACRDCNFGMAQERFVPASSEKAAVAHGIRDRIFAPVPIYPRDDPVGGVTASQWVLAERRLLLRERRSLQTTAEP